MCCVLCFQRHSVFVSVHPWVSESVHPEKPYELNIAKNEMKGISPNFCHRCIWVHGFADWFWGSKGQGHSSRFWFSENWMNTISQKTMKEFHPILVTDVFEFIDMMIRFWGQKTSLAVVCLVSEMIYYVLSVMFNHTHSFTSSANRIVFHFCSARRFWFSVWCRWLN